MAGKKKAEKAEKSEKTAKTVQTEAAVPEAGCCGGNGSGCHEHYEKMCREMGDFAPATLKSIKKLNPAFLAQLHEMDQIVTQDGALSKKDKRLMALACVCVRMCEDCVYPQAKVAKNYGATQAEILEAVQVAVLIGGVPCWSCAKAGIGKLFEEWDQA